MSTSSVARSRSSHHISCQSHSSLPVTPITEERTVKLRARRDLVEVADVRFEREERRAPSATRYSGVMPSTTIAASAGVPEHQHVVGLGEVPVVVDPLRADVLRPLQAQASGALPSTRRISTSARSRSRTRSAMLRDPASSVAAAHHPVAQLGGELGGCQPGPRREQRRSEVVEHVRHAARPAREVEREHRAVERPPQARAVGDRRVDLLDRRLAVGHHVQRLPPERLLQPVGDEPGHLAVHRDHRLADVPEERRRPLHDVGGGLLPADDLDQRDQVRRVERVRHHQPLRRARLDRHLRHAEARTWTTRRRRARASRRRWRRAGSA